MAIYIYTGKPRHGKTMEVVRIACALLKRKERVFSNIKINLGVGALKKIKDEVIGDLWNKADIENPEKLLFYWQNIHEWEHMKNGNILCDELTVYFNPRNWASLSEDTEKKLRQHGKDDLTIWGTTQHYSRVDVALRQIVEKFYIVKTVFGSPDNKKRYLGFKRFEIVGLDLEDIEDYYSMIKFPDREMVLDYESYHRWFWKKYAMCYDTKQVVGRSLPVPLLHEERNCELCGKQMITHR